MQRDLNDMAIFARIVEAGTLTAAAARLGLPKSNISRRLARLEDALNVRLLERTTRSLRLTEIGEIYFRHCQRLLEEVDHAEESIAALAEAPRGLLRVSTSITIGQHLLAPLLATFMVALPEVRLQLQLTTRRVDLIHEGFDLAIRAGELEDSSLVGRRLCQSTLSWCASPAYLKAYGKPGHPGELAGHDCLLLAETDGVRHVHLIGQNGQERFRIEPHAIVNDFSTLRTLAIAGAGIALMPDYMIGPAVGEQQLTRIMPNWSSPPIDIHALFPSHRGATPKVRAFLDFLVKRLDRTTGQDTDSGVIAGLDVS